MYYLLAIIALVLTTGAQSFITYAYNKYSKVSVKSGFNGLETAKKILSTNGLDNLKIEQVEGYLSDHYDPSSKTVRLSNSIYTDVSISSVAVAAHECGHAIQDKVKYFFLKLRATMVPIVNFSSYAGYLAIVVGCALGSLDIIWLGIFFEAAICAFQVITLPVEVNASRRALKQLKSLSILTNDELRKAKVVLAAAALTYVASVATALVQILRLVLMYGKKNK